MLGVQAAGVDGIKAISSMRVEAKKLLLAQLISQNPALLIPLRVSEPHIHVPCLDEEDLEVSSSEEELHDMTSI